MQGLSIIIPTYNEKKNLEILIPKIYSRIKTKKFQILIVDDNSQDGTRQLLKKMLPVYKKLKYILRKTKPKDLSQSCILGFSKSKYNNILVMDGDLQHRPEDINKLYSFYLKKKVTLLLVAEIYLEKKIKALSFID